LWATLISTSATIAALSAVGSAATPNALTISQTATPPSQKTVSFEEVLQGKIALDFDGSAPGKIELYPLDSMVVDRATNACVLDAPTTHVDIDLEAQAKKSEVCQTLLGALQRGSSVEWAVSQPGSSAYAIIRFTAPRAYAGQPSEIVVPRDDKDMPDWSKAEIPGAVALSSNDCYVLIDKWHALRCGKNGRLIEPGSAQASIAAAWSQGKASALIMKVRDAESSSGAWRSFPFKLKPKEGPPSPTPLTLPKPEGLVARCNTWAKKGLASEDRYVICVDAYSTGEGVVTLECKAKKKDDEADSCKSVGDVVRVRRNFVVYVWHPQETRAQISLGGDAGFASQVYDRGTELKGIREPGESRGGEEPSVRSFGPRKPGTANLSVKIFTGFKEDIKEPKKPTELFEVTQTYKIEAVYRAALRLGIGFSWAPAARRVGVRTSPDGQNYAAVVEGAESGLVSSEIVAGASYFLCDMPENEMKVCGALGLRFGLVGMQGSEVKGLGSLMVGPEVALGKDFSIGLFGGLMRHDTPAAGYEPGKVLSSGTTTIPTQFGVTPGFGLVVNFTPGFLSNVGMIK